jgi:4-amino-4-deoxy-L-arabinose transferase-like glycosyltransferase
MRKWLLIGIIAGAFLLRVIGLTNYPVGFTADEASFGYDAYSILKTGKDQWGQSFPLTFRSFGDFKLPAYTYLALPSVAVFGLNEFAVRLPNAILGTLAIFVTYLLVLEIFKTKKLTVNNQTLAIIASFLLAISSWHISLSRGAFEANLTTFFMPLGVWLFLKGIKRPKLMVLAAVVFGLNMFTYHSARLVTPLLVLFLVWLKRDKVEKKKLHLASFIFLLFLGLSVFQLAGGGGSRASDVIIFNPTDNWRAVSDRRYEAVLTGLPD